MIPTHALDHALAGGGIAALPIALAAGLVMGLNPCCLALYPAAAASCCAGACHEQERPTLPRAALFVLGTAVSMTVLGVVAALAGEAMSGVGGWLAYLIAAVPIVMGLKLLGVVRIPMPRAVSGWRSGGLAGAFFTGLFFSLVISPCGTPALAAILSVAALKGSVAFGALLLFAYGLGNGLPLLLVGAAAGAATKALRRFGSAQWINRGAGVAMVVLGGYLLVSAVRGG